MTTRGAMFAADDLHTYQTGEDPMAAIRSQLARDMSLKMNQKLMAQLGVWFRRGRTAIADNVATCPSAPATWPSATTVTHLSDWCEVPPGRARRHPLTPSPSTVTWLPGSKRPVR